jgi:hypothetical protein
MSEHYISPHFDFADIADGMGDRPVMVHENKFCEDCGKEHEFEKCPKCGSWIDIGFGLMFGGYGPYKFCQSDECDWFYKEQVEE